MKRTTAITGYIIVSFLGVFLYAAPEQPVCTDKSKVCKLLNKWYKEGSAAGNTGDFYDNRDRNHSRVKLESYPQLNEVEYTFDERSQYKDWAGQHKILPHVTVGNSSTAGKLGSNPRAWYYTTQEGMNFLYSQYRKNNLYVYPEHKDYDPIAMDGKNDTFPTNSPYLVISKGSSGSDRQFLHAFLRTLAAFDPKVKTTLVNTGMLMPTVQQIFRMSNAQVNNDGDYLSGKAHPPVFEGKNIREKKMIEKAHSMTLEKIPPIVNLKEIEVTDGSPAFKTSEEESLANTPSVIAKVYRGNEPKKKIVVSAEDSTDLFARPLKYHWIVLHGDKDNIEIDTKDEGKTAEIIFPYQHPFVVDNKTGLKSSRIDIGVFADNGITLSAPAFITVYNLPNELRTYSDKGNIQEIFYAAKEMGISVKSWSDLLKVITNKDGTYPTELFQENYSPEQVAFFLKQEPRIKILEQDVINAKIELDNLKELRKKVGNRLVPNKEIKELNKKLVEAKQSLHQALSQKHAILNNHSIQEDLLQVIDSYIYDLSFYNREQKLIDSVAKGKQRQLHSIVGRLSRDGVLKKNPKELTRYEKSEIEELNLYIFSNILYPSSIKMWVKPNYVDPRLTTPKKTLRRFEYDTKGNKTGQNDTQVH